MSLISDALAWILFVGFAAVGIATVALATVRVYRLAKLRGWSEAAAMCSVIVSAGLLGLGAWVLVDVAWLLTWARRQQLPRL